MTRKNPYKKSSHLSVWKSRKIIQYFCMDLTATTTSKLLSIERKTVNRWYDYIREIIFYRSIEEDKEVWKWIIEVDESYFGPRRVKGKRGRWASHKIKVLGLLKRNGKVYVQIVSDCSAKSLLPIIRGKVDPKESIINTDRWKSYDGLIDLGYKKHYRVCHSKNEFARGKKHINGIESFRSFTKRRLTKFNGVPKHKFLLHLKETEFRFNCRLQNIDMYKQLSHLLKSFTSV